ncbi:MAG: AAA family ATPase [Ruminococcaceae bacterium]|nr:AAA family ATPase [Oscillospiraceae bacterium]
MNIKEAKIEISNTLRAYLAKDLYGNYRIPPVRQRPVLLMGPPGVGKTQIMEQIAAETGVGLVAYTITHHTRQSAVGLPFIEAKTYDGVEHHVTEYTMSEILASVHELMARTGIREGILFLDEINCVSETLTPMMLQFLQCKTFGNQPLPEGWLIVAAGNPPEYNRSVREFDVVTLDRVRRMDVTEDYSVWKEYALRKGLHGAVISYLDIKKDNFYRIETTADGPQFATARGWEDLSELIYAYEALGLQADRSVVGEYIQLPRIAKDFANYLQLYYKYRKTYHVEEILSGSYPAVTASEFRAAPFDEKLSVMGLLLSRLGEAARAVRKQDAVTGALHGSLTAFKERIAAQAPQSALAELIAQRQEAMRVAREAGHLNAESRELCQRELTVLDACLGALREADIVDADAAMREVRTRFAAVVETRKSLGEETGALFDHAFAFLEDAIGESQELVLFVTELTAGYDTSWFVENFGCEAYFRHNKALLLDETHERILREIEKGRLEDL